MIALIAAALAPACRGSSETGTMVGQAGAERAADSIPSGEFENRFGSGDKDYTATWYVDPRASGREVPAEPYTYFEAIDDPNGNYRVETPRHYAVQTVTDVYLCAVDGIATCARAPRQEGAPNIASIAITTLRRLSPESVYEISGEVSFRIAEIREPDAWASTQENHRDVPVQCWTVVGETSTAPPGFRVCYTNDASRLIAELDVTGDGELDVDLTNYVSGTDASLFGAPPFFEDDARVYEQLVDLFPDVPVPPTPTPDPFATPDPLATPEGEPSEQGDGQPANEGEPIPNDPNAGQGVATDPSGG